MTSKQLNVNVARTSEGPAITFETDDGSSFDVSLTIEQARMMARSLWQQADAHEYGEQGGDLEAQGEIEDAPCATSAEMREQFDRVFAKDPGNDE